MAAPAVLRIDIVADATKALKALKDTGDTAESAGGGWKKAGSAIAGVVSAGAVVAFGTSSVKAAEESAVATARLEQIFASMGDTTGTAAKAAEDYATSLSKKIGVDDEAILGAQAQLATFGSVSSETARMAGIFDRATAAGADLAAAGFGTLDSNAVQLGKALENPTKGMTALTRSGVTFTEAQKDQIKALQESGDLLGAQNIVLGAVEKQVGGTAEATATSSDKMKVAFGEVQEQIGGKLMPVVAGLMDLFTKYSDIIVPLVGVIAGVVAVTWLWNAAQSALAVVQGIAAAATWLFNAALAANPIVLVVIAIAALVGALILAYNKVGWFRDFVDAAFDAVVAAFNKVKDVAVAVFNWIADNWPLLLAILTGPVGIAILLITRNFDTIKDVAQSMVQWVTDRFQDLLGFVSRVGATFSAIMSGFADALRLPIDAATAMYNWVRDKVQALLDVVSGVRDRVSGMMSGVADALKGPLNAVIRAWNGVQFTVPSVDVGPVHFGGQTIGVPDVPLLAKGGTVLRTGLALVHEGETFSGVGRSSSSPTTITVNISHTGLGVDSPKLQRDVVAAIRGYVGRNGPLGAPIVAPS
jgi:hypothetical protein